MSVTRLRPSISEIEGQPQPGTRRIDAIRGPSISEIEGQPQLGSTMTGCLGWPSISEIEADRTVCVRSEEHTSELQSLMRISYAVFCLKKKKSKEKKKLDTLKQHTQINHMT